MKNGFNSAAVYIVDALRSPRGAAKASGALNALHPVQLLSALILHLNNRYALPKNVFSDFIVGNVTQFKEQGANIAKTTALYADLGDTVPGITINRFCTSGLEAVQFAALKIMAGDSSVLAGGVEMMSRVAMFSDLGAWFNDAEISEKTHFIHMGLAADWVATRYGIARADCDEFAWHSHQRAAKAAALSFPSLVPVTVGEKTLLADETIRPGLSLEKMAALPPAFADIPGKQVLQARFGADIKLNPVHTIASAPAQADGAGLCWLANAEELQRLGLKPRAEVIGFATVSVDAVEMLTGVVLATQQALKKAHLKISDIDLFECNESFSAVVLNYQQALAIDADKVNVTGGAIARGHALGATGVILLATLLDELERRHLNIGCVAMCGGAGVASAMIVRRWV